MLIYIYNMLNYLSKKKKKNDGYFSVISKNKTVGKKNKWPSLKKEL